MVIYMESVLTTIKKMLGITEECTHFDDVIVVHINSALFILSQLGVGSAEGMHITDDITIWCDLMPTLRDMESMKSYIYFRVKLAFDPPTSNALLTAMQANVDELEWRLQVTAESLDYKAKEEI